MAIKKLYLGPFGPFLYDDAETINDPDGDFVGITRKAMLTDGDIESGGVSSTSGASGTITVVTNVRVNLGATEKKTCTLTLSNGLITSVGAESAWIAV